MSTNSNLYRLIKLWKKNQNKLIPSFVKLLVFGGIAMNTWRNQIEVVKTVVWQWGIAERANTRKTAAPYFVKR